MRFRASPTDASETLAFEVRWGPWVVRKRLRWPQPSAVNLWHTKGDDGLSIPVIVRADRPITVSFNLGAAPAGADRHQPWLGERRSLMPMRGIAKLSASVRVGPGFDPAVTKDRSFSCVAERAPAGSDPSPEAIVRKSADAHECEHPPGQENPAGAAGVVPGD